MSPDGSTLFVANSKNVPGPNSASCKHILGTGADSDPVCLSANQCIQQLQKGGMSTIPVQDRKTLRSPTAQVAANRHQG